MRLIKWPFYGLLLALVVLGASPFVSEWYLVSKLEKAGYDVEVKSVGLNVFSGGLSLNGLSLATAQGERLNVAEASADVDMLTLLSGRIELSTLEIDGAVIDVSSDGRDLFVGGISIEDLGSALERSLNVELARVVINNSEFCVKAKKQCLHVESATSGRVSLTLSSQGWSFAHRSPLYITKAFLRDLSNDIAAFYLGKLDVKSGEYSSRTSRLDGLNVQNFQFVQNYALNAPNTVLMAQTQMGDMSLSSLAVNAVDKVSIRLGDLTLVSPRQSLIKKTGLEKAPFNTDQWLMAAYEQLLGMFNGQENLAVSVNSVLVQSGIVSWQDTLITPRAHEQLTTLRLELGAMDSLQPKKTTDVKLSSKLGERGQFSFDGLIYPFGPAPSLKGKVSLLGWDLSKMSAYTSSLFKQTVNEGFIDVAFNVDLQNHKLKVDSLWLLSDFVFDASSQSSQLSKTLNVVKDRNHSVRLELDFQGEFPSKEMTLTHVFGDLLPSTLMSLSQKQLGDEQKEFIPGGLVLGSAKRESKMEYRSILYLANRVEPEAVDAKRLWDIAETLKSKPHLTVFFCPVSTVGEWAEVFNNGVRPGEGFELHSDERQRLSDLARARGKHLRQELVDQGVATSQINICQPTIDLSNVGLSFVTVSI